jgi:hypothetical protein
MAGLAVMVELVVAVLFWAEGSVSVIASFDFIIDLVSDGRRDLASGSGPRIVPVSVRSSDTSKIKEALELLDACCRVRDLAGLPLRLIVRRSDSWRETGA